MKKKEQIKKYLFDIKVAIESVEDYVSNIEDLESYQNNKLIRRAVEREIEIIGEAVNRILNLDETIQISNGRRIVDTRNWVIHGYDNVDNTIVWAIITKHLPLLEKEVRKLLDKK
jgi:uncharacterized protein with HEPN domain